MSKEISRRKFLKIAGVTVAGTLLGVTKGPSPLPSTETSSKICLPDTQAKKEIKNDECELVDAYNSPEDSKDSRVLQTQAGDGVCPEEETSVTVKSYGGVGALDRCEAERSEK